MQIYRFREMHPISLKVKLNEFSGNGTSWYRSHFKDCLHLFFLLKKNRHFGLILQIYTP